MKPSGNRTTAIVSMLLAITMLIALGIASSRTGISFLPGTMEALGRNIQMPFRKNNFVPTEASTVPENPLPTAEYTDEQKSAIERLKSLGY